MSLRRRERTPDKEKRRESEPTVRILVVHQYFLDKDDAGGSRWNQLAKYWGRAGHQVTVLGGNVHYATGRRTPQCKGKYIHRETVDENVTAMRCHVSETYNVSFIGRLWAYASFTLSSIWAGLHSGKQDVIIATSPPLTTALTGWALSRLKRIPMVFEVRDLWPETAIEMGVLTNPLAIKLGYLLERKAYRWADLINTLTPAFDDTLRNKKNVPPDKLIMIPNAADLDLMEPGPKENDVRAQLGLTGKRVITYVGAHGRCNGLMQIVRAAERTRDDPDLIWMLVGDGMEKPMLIEAARKKNLTNIRFVPPVPKAKIADYINASDVCCAVLRDAPVFRTVYPNKVFDYMSCRRPTVVAIDGVARMLVEESGAGLFVQPENDEALADAARQLTADPQRCEDLGRRGREYVKANFDRYTLGRRYLEHVVNVVRKRRRRTPTTKRQSK